MDEKTLPNQDLKTAYENLLQRKQLYKEAAARHFARMQIVEKRWEDAKAQLAEKKREVRTWKANYRKELIMKKRWKTACYLSTAALAAVLIAAVTINQLSSLMLTPPTPRGIPTGNIQRTPNYVLATVNIYNGDLQGSGVVISQGENRAAILSAAHNFRGNLAGFCWVYFPDGTYTKGTLKAFDRKRDLALVDIPADTVLARAYVPESMKGLTGTLAGVGYSGGQGPNYRTLSYNKTYRSARTMWDLQVVKGPFWDGDSGGGVFMGDALVGITLEREANRWSRNCQLYACAHNEIVDFLREHQVLLADSGDWRSLPAEYVDADRPPLWQPTPNVPIYVESGTDRMLRDLQEQVASLRQKVPLGQKEEPSPRQRPSDVE